MLKRLISSFVLTAFLFTNLFSGTGYAQVVLPMPGTMLTPTAVYNPAMIRGVNIDPNNPLKFDFILDRGDKVLSDSDFKLESSKLVKYFLAALTVPQKEMWVNLSPNEPDRIIPENFGKTEMGRDVLAQDYLLKQLTSSLMYPENELGKKFWSKIYERAKKELGTTDIPTDTYNKVWIVPQVAKIYEHSKGAFIVSTHLKVLLEEDYFAKQQAQISKSIPRTQDEGLHDAKLKVQLMHQIIIPEIEREVNEGEIFANLRQIYSSMVLALWYKQALKNSALGQAFVDQKKTSGLETGDVKANQKIYDQYLAAFKKGVYDYVKEEYEPSEQKIISRKYFSGGVSADRAQINTIRKSDAAVLNAVDKLGSRVKIASVTVGDEAMLSGTNAMEFLFASYADIKGVMRGLEEWKAKDRDEAERLVAIFAKLMPKLDEFESGEYQLSSDEQQLLNKFGEEFIGSKDGILSFLKNLKKSQIAVVPPGIVKNVHRDKKVFITGGGGYIGKNVAYELLKAGSDVVLYDVSPRNVEALIKEFGEKRVEVVRQDMRDLHMLKRAMLGCDSVVHLGAYIAAGDSTKRPAQYYDDNVLATLNLLKTMKELGISNLSFASSAGVYDGINFNKNEVLDETIHANPQNPYGETKLMMERLMKAYGEDINWFAVRFFNVAGAVSFRGRDGKEYVLGEDHDGAETHVIARAIQSLKENKIAFKKFGIDYNTPDGTNVRDYIHVGDLAKAIVRTLAVQYVNAEKKMKTAQIVNLGTGSGTSVNEITEAILQEHKAATGEDLKFKDAPRRPGDPDALKASGLNAFVELGFVPTRGVKEIVRSAYKYHVTHPINIDNIKQPEAKDQTSESKYLETIRLSIMQNKQIPLDVRFEILYRLFIDMVREPAVNYRVGKGMDPFNDKQKELIEKIIQASTVIFSTPNVSIREQVANSMILKKLFIDLYLDLKESANTFEKLDFTRAMDSFYSMAYLGEDLLDSKNDEAMISKRKTDEAVWKEWKDVDATIVKNLRDWLPRETFLNLMAEKTKNQETWWSVYFNNLGEVIGWEYRRGKAVELQFNGTRSEYVLRGDNDFDGVIATSIKLYDQSICLAMGPRISNKITPQEKENGAAWVHGDGWKMPFLGQHGINMKTFWRNNWRSSNFAIDVGEKKYGNIIGADGLKKWVPIGLFSQAGELSVVLVERGSQIVEGKIPVERYSLKGIRFGRDEQFDFTTRTILTQKSVGLSESVFGEFYSEEMEIDNVSKTGEKIIIPVKINNKEYSLKIFRDKDGRFFVYESYWLFDLFGDDKTEFAEFFKLLASLVPANSILENVIDGIKKQIVKDPLSLVKINGLGEIDPYPNPNSDKAMIISEPDKIGIADKGVKEYTREYPVTVIGLRDDVVALRLGSDAPLFIDEKDQILGFLEKDVTRFIENEIPGNHPIEEVDKVVKQIRTYMGVPKLTVVKREASQSSVKGLKVTVNVTWDRAMQSAALQIEGRIFYKDSYGYGQVFAFIKIDGQLKYMLQLLQHQDGGTVWGAYLVPEENFKSNGSIGTEYAKLSASALSIRPIIYFPHDLFVSDYTKGKLAKPNDKYPWLEDLVRQILTRVFWQTQNDPGINLQKVAWAFNLPVALGDLSFNGIMRKQVSVEVSDDEGFVRSNVNFYEGDVGDIKITKVDNGYRVYYQTRASKDWYLIGAIDENLVGDENFNACTKSKMWLTEAVKQTIEQAQKLGMTITKDAAMMKASQPPNQFNGPYVREVAGQKQVVAFVNIYGLNNYMLQLVAENNGWHVLMVSQDYYVRSMGESLGTIASRMEIESRNDRIKQKYFPALCIVGLKGFYINGELSSHDSIKTDFPWLEQLVSEVLAKLPKDKAALVKDGGIDLNNTNLDVNKVEGGFKINADAAMIQQIQNATGLVPVRIDIFTVGNLRLLLGLSDTTTPSVASDESSPMDRKVNS
ncbi:MAG: SDR family NAD(P)-dependent oxidoreductase [Candidatus Omnitrophica bacterium]|nr:SDR family NAD(P)-dependent oxidoreductase [Candidatus Omnitrophota bacterium]